MTIGALVAPFDFRMLPNENGHLLATLCDRLFKGLERAILMVAEPIGQRGRIDKRGIDFRYYSTGCDSFAKILIFSLDLGKRIFQRADRTRRDPRQGSWRVVS